MSILAETLYDTRRLKNITQQMVANQAGISIAAYHLIESGKVKNPRRKTLEAICLVLGLDLDKILIKS